MANLASLLVLGLVLGTLVGAVVSAAPTLSAASAGPTTAAGSPSGNHGACVVAAVRAALLSRDPGTGIGWLVHAMARRC